MDSDPMSTVLFVASLSVALVASVAAVYDSPRAARALAAWALLLALVGIGAAVQEAGRAGLYTRYDTCAQVLLIDDVLTCVPLDQAG